MKVGDKVMVKSTGYIGTITEIKNRFSKVYFLDSIYAFGFLEEDLEIISNVRFNKDFMEYLLS